MHMGGGLRTNYKHVYIRFSIGKYLTLDDLCNNIIIIIILYGHKRDYGYL